MTAYEAGCPYPISDLAEQFPVSDKKRHAALVTRISEYGFRPSVLVWRGEIIFGLEFLNAYAEAGLEPQFEILPDDAEPVPSLAAVAIPALDLDNNHRAVMAYLASQWSKRGRPRTEEEKSAKLRNLTQEQAGNLFGVGTRQVTHAAQVLSADSPAAPALRQAVREWRIRAIDASRVVSRPPEVQERAVGLVMSRQFRTVRRAVERVEQEIAQEAEEEAVAEMMARPLDEAIEIRVGDPAALLRVLPADSINAIITQPPLVNDKLFLLSDLADLAAHVLKPAGFVAVVGSSMLLPQQLRHLEHEGIRWIMQVTIHMGGPPVDSGSPHHVKLHQRPLLIYGKPGFRPPPGWSDLIEVPNPEDDPSGLDRNELMMRLVAERLCRPGGVVCDPIMLDRAGAAVAARGQGCPFIGATEHQSTLGRIWRRVVEVGLPEAPDGDGAPEIEAIPG